MRKHGFFAFFVAFVTVTAMMMCSMYSFADVTLSKPISTNTVKPENIDVSGFSGMLLIDLKGDALLYARGSADNKVSASESVVTLMSLYAALVNLEQDMKVTCGDVSSLSGIGLEEGMILTVKDLAAAVLFENAEDALFVLGEAAEKESGREMQAMMNDAAHELKMNSTYYANATGEYDPIASTSLRDLAILCEAVYSQPFISEMLDENSYSISTVDGGFSETLRAECAVEIRDAYTYTLAEGRNDGGAAVCVLAVKESRPLLITLSIDAGDTVRYSSACEDMFDFGYEEFSLVDFAPMADALLETAVISIDDIEVSGFTLTTDGAIEMNEAVAASMADSILGNPDAFSLKSVDETVENGVVTATFELVYLNNDTLGIFEAAANAPDELAEIYATPTPKSTSTGYEEVVNTSKEPVAEETEEPFEEEEKNFKWVIYIAVVTVAALVVIIIAEVIKSRMMKY